MNGSEHPSGYHTRNEILSQPACWEQCFRLMKEQLAGIGKQFQSEADWVFIGCGSSYYIAQSAAASWTALTGLRAKAVPASEVLLFPDLILSGEETYQPVLISRSGHTSEVLRAAEYLELRRNIRTLAISCANHQPLEAISSSTLYLLPADEKSTVMTRSFTSMLLGLQSLAAFMAGDEGFISALAGLPSMADRALESMQPLIEKFVKAHEFADYVFLAQGPFLGVASESHLKIKEMSCSYAQVFHTLEFRHGPKAIVGPEMLVTFLLSETGYAAERDVLREIKGLGATTLVITNQADAVVRQNADLLIELHLDVPEVARLAPYTFAGQILGLCTGLKKGHNPDWPRNLSRAVVLSDDRENGSFQHASV
jgi:glucosamine--fructose-6-phosphate aminotransferase (isomerizing)